MTNNYYMRTGDNADNKPTGTIVGTCPECGKPLKIKRGTYGKFIGCTGYKKGCRYSHNTKTYTITNQKYIDLFNLERARLGQDLKKATHILKTNPSLKKQANKTIKEIKESIWRTQNGNIRL